jgi:hypothetical protein
MNKSYELGKKAKQNDIKYNDNIDYTRITLLGLPVIPNRHICYERITIDAVSFWDGYNS